MRSEGLVVITVVSMANVVVWMMWRPYGLVVEIVSSVPTWTRCRGHDGPMSMMR